MLDYVPHAAAPQERVHKYLPIEVRNGDEVALEGYYSHPFPGTMPYDEYSTFALDGLYPRRRYEGIWLCEMDDGVCSLCNMLELLNKRFLAEEGFARAQTEKVYEKLFEILPLAPQRPDEQSVQSATAVIADYMSKPPRLPFVGLIGHSHLDTAWLWTVEETRRKLMRTLSNAVTLLEKYPDYKFILSTVLYLKWVEEDDPDLFERVKSWWRRAGWNLTAARGWSATAILRAAKPFAVSCCGESGTFGRSSTTFPTPFGCPTPSAIPRRCRSLW